MMLRLGLGSRGAAKTAITDLYDEQTGQLLIQYPQWLIVTLGMVGIGAFAFTGFTGYEKTSPFSEPWVLYLWLCAVFITLESSIFRDRTLRLQRTLIITVTLIAIILVGLLRFGNLLPDFIQQLIAQIKLGGLAANPWTWTILNFGLLAIFWADSIRRWFRRARGLAPNEQVAILPGETTGPASAEDLPALEEIVSGDLLAGALLAFALSVVLDASILSPLLRNPNINTCTVTLAGTGCVAPGDVNSLLTLHFIDRIQALAYLPLSLLILALAATISGLGAAGGIAGMESAALTPVVERGARTGQTTRIAGDVSLTVVNTLRGAIERRLGNLVRNLALSLRTVLWPVFIFAGVYGLDQLAEATQSYLHSSKGVNEALTLLGPAVIWALAASLGLAFAAALIIFRWRVASNTLRFLALIGFVLLLTLWIFSGALLVFNLLLNKINATPREPFIPWGASSYFSLVALLAWGAYALFIRQRRARPRDAGAEPAPTATYQEPVATTTREGDA
ncbi:MAG TPA: hypothetical protein VF807_00625 [Ktedonobacterales bacterium]